MNKMESRWQNHIPANTVSPFEAQHISECIYMFLCHEVGASSIVSMRRDIMDISEKLNNQVEKDSNNVQMASGSQRDGFRLEGSDFDRMFWSKHYQVVWDLSQVQYKHSSKLTHIFADCSDSPPGFVLLHLPISTADESLLKACIRLDGKQYISSSLYIQNKCIEYGLYSQINGPCVRVNKGFTEFDDAHCFVSDLWPLTASSWMDRCHIWPPAHIAKDIIAGGCHFVAIGHKLGNHWNNEWRISFSSAEKKLVYSMNQFQFFIYGLLKIFLKEVINNTPFENNLLCSYHVKTAVFWAIHSNTIPGLCLQNFLKGFWICFKLILKWVYEGSCPNFFIPENNMFVTKIFGTDQKKLFFRLYALYEKGLSCLLESATIKYALYKKGLLCMLESANIKHFYLSFLYNPKLAICTDDNTLLFDGEFERQLFREICANDDICKPNLFSCVRVLYSIEQLIGLPLKQCQVFMLQKRSVPILQIIAFMLHSDFISHSSSYKNRKVNKLVYFVDKMSIYMLKFSTKFGFFFDMLYLVMYYYKTRRYTTASSLLKVIRIKLAQIYMYDFYVNMDRRKAIHFWTIKMRELLMYLRLYNEISYVNELEIERHCSLQNNEPYLHIPIFVLFHMLEFLCYKNVDSMRSKAALDNLQFFVNHAESKFMDEFSRDISWQIVGICQQIYGNHEAALYAYLQALAASPVHIIRTATLIRILIIAHRCSQQVRNRKRLLYF